MLHINNYSIIFSPLMGIKEMNINCGETCNGRGSGGFAVCPPETKAF